MKNPEELFSVIQLSEGLETRSHQLDQMHLALKDACDRASSSIKKLRMMEKDKINESNFLLENFKFINQTKSI